MANLSTRHRKLSDFSREREVELLTKIGAGDRLALAELCIAMEPIVYHQSRIYARVSSVGLEDLEQEARVAILHAAKMFNLDKGTRFSTYAATCVANGLIDYISQDLNALSGLEAKIKLRWDEFSGMSVEDIAMSLSSTTKAVNLALRKVGTVLRFGAVVTTLDCSFLEQLEYTDFGDEEGLQGRAGLTDLEMDIIEALLDKKSFNQIEYEFDLLFGLGKHLRSIRTKLRNAAYEIQSVNSR